MIVERESVGPDRDPGGGPLPQAGRAARFPTDDRRWEAVVGRDPSADGAFVYGVKTTGIFCRPTCRSRVPNRSNARFFADCGEAERAGYRACKRCRPSTEGAGRDRSEAIVRACKRIEEADEAPSLEDLARGAGLSPSHFHRLFKATVGVTPKAYAAGLRVRRLQEGLARGKPVTRAIYDAGFGSSSRAYDGAAQGLGMTPSEFRDGAPGVAIRYAAAPTSLGWVVVGATDRGVCSISLGDEPEGLVAQLRARFPGAVLEDHEPALAAWLRAIVAYLESPRLGLDLPLDIRGTAFQRRVWEALRAIPLGSTASYAEIARGLGHPTAARAVARACATNPVALIVPCHRVIRGDGGLGGYYWGLGRKRALLEGEAEGAGDAGDGPWPGDDCGKADGADVSAISPPVVDAS